MHGDKQTIEWSARFIDSKNELMQGILVLNIGYQIVKDSWKTIYSLDEVEKYRESLTKVSERDFQDHFARFTHELKLAEMKNTKVSASQQAEMKTKFITELDSNEIPRVVKHFTFHIRRSQGIGQPEETLPVEMQDSLSELRFVHSNWKGKFIWILNNAEVQKQIQLVTLVRSLF